VTGVVADVVGVVCDGAGVVADAVGVVGDGAGELDEGADAVGDGVVGVGDGVVGVGDGVVGAGVVGAGPGVDLVTAGEGWLLPGLLLVAGVVLPGVKSDEVVTITVAEAREVPICAVTRVVPGLIPVTRPEESTVAMAGFPVVQAAPARICGGALLPLASWPVNGGWVLPAVPIRSVRGSMVSEWIWMVMPWGVGRVAWSEVKALAQRASRAMVAPAGLTAAR
jgi:hypothetical protein